MSYFGTNRSINIRPVQGESAVKPVTLMDAASWLKAEASLVIHGPVSSEVFEARKSQCMACPERATDTDPPDEIGFCKACGCGTRARAALTVKLTMPAVSCPLKKW